MVSTFPSSSCSSEVQRNKIYCDFFDKIINSLDKESCYISLAQSILVFLDPMKKGDSLPLWLKAMPRSTEEQHTGVWILTEAFCFASVQKRPLHPEKSFEKDIAMLKQNHPQYACMGCAFLFKSFLAKAKLWGKWRIMHCTSEGEGRQSTLTAPA